MCFIHFPHMSSDLLLLYPPLTCLSTYFDPFYSTFLSNNVPSHVVPFNLFTFSRPFFSLLLIFILFILPPRVPFFPPAVPAARQKPWWLWVVEAVPVLLQWGRWQDAHQNHWCVLWIPEWISGLHWKARHHAVDWQVGRNTHSYTGTNLSACQLLPAYRTIHVCNIFQYLSME